MNKILGSPSVLKLLSARYSTAFSCRKAKIIEIWSFLTTITAKTNSTIITMVHAKINCKGQKKTWIPDLSNAHGFPCSVCSALVFTLFATYSPEPRFGVEVSHPVSHTEIYRNWAIFVKRLKQKVNSEGKNSLQPFSKESKVVLLYSIKTVVSHLKGYHVPNAGIFDLIWPNFGAPRWGFWPKFFLR